MSNTEDPSIIRLYLGERWRSWIVKSVVKGYGSTVKLKLKMGVLSTVEVGGIRGVEVKC